MQIYEKTVSEKIFVGLVIAILVVMIFNIFQLTKLKSRYISDNVDEEAIEDVNGFSVLPKGIPEVYGKELVVSFSDVSAMNSKKADETISKLGLLDRKLSLTGDDLNRYIEVTSQISCEYCCGAESIVVTIKNEEVMEVENG